MDSPTPRPKTDADLEPATTPEVEVPGGATEGDLVLNEVQPAPLRNTRRPTALGDFQLVERIGAGAMSVVYSARQVSKDRPAAVKVLRPHLATDPLFLQRFLREADVMARLRHPNIVRCYSVGKQHGYHYIAMELIEGHTLGDWIVKIGRLSLGDVIHVTLACARALQHAHQNGLIHRDVKPDNVLITREGHIKLIDLGLARPLLEVDVTTTQEGHGAGTPVYVAPEQARDARDADPRSDLYSLGCVIYQMLTGQQAFRGDKALDIILAKINGQYTPPRHLIPDLPEDVETILACLLAPHPDERYQSATDLVRELEAMQMASPVLSFLGSTAEVPEPSDSESPALTENDLTPTAADAPLRSEKRWFVLSRSVNGDWITRRYTTSQILQSLKHDPEFARSAQASLYRDAFRPLIEYAEFHDAVLLHEPHQDSLHHPHREGKSLLVLIALLAGAVSLGFALAWLLLRT